MSAICRFMLLLALGFGFVVSPGGFAYGVQGEKVDQPQAGATKPLRVFILAGQSNMQGHASVSTFDSMADDAKTATLLAEMLGPDKKPRVCEKVWISSVGCLGDAYSDLTEAKGRLTTGFGAPENKIGPEFTFGITMEKLLGEPIRVYPEQDKAGGYDLYAELLGHFIRDVRKDLSAITTSVPSRSSRRSVKRSPSNSSS